MNIDVDHHSSATNIYRLLYQAADCGHKGEGHWQIKASLQGGSGQGLLQLKISPTLKLENNSLFFAFPPHPDFYSILDTDSVWNNSNQRALPKRK